MIAPRTLCMGIDLKQCTLKLDRRAVTIQRPCFGPEIKAWCRLDSSDSGLVFRITQKHHPAGPHSPYGPFVGGNLGRLEVAIASVTTLGISSPTLPHTTSFAISCTPVSCTFVSQFGLTDPCPLKVVARLLEAVHRGWRSNSMPCYEPWRVRPKSWTKRWPGWPTSTRRKETD
jgi:hypothetical protein